MDSFPKSLKTYSRAPAIPVRFMELRRRLMPETPFLYVLGKVAEIAGTRIT